MAATLSQVRDGLATRMNAITGLRCFAYMHPKPEPPAMCISGPLSGTEYGSSFDGMWRPQFNVWVFVNPADLYRAQQSLDVYLDNTGAKSIPASIEADPDLAGLAVSCRVVSLSREPQLTETAGGQLLGAALALECLVT